MGTTFDPFEPGFSAWPYDQYRRLRESDPVHWSELLCGWMVTRYDDAAKLLRDQTMSSELERATPSAVVDALLARQEGQGSDGVTLVLRDDPEHARLRKLMQQPFTVKAIEQLRTSVQQRVDNYLDHLAEQDSMELIGDFAYPLPVGVFCEMLGIPEEASPRFRQWTAAVATSLDIVIEPAEYDRCMQLLGEMEIYLDEIASAKHAQPADDVLSALVHAEVDGERFEPHELHAQLVTLYVAGHEPTTALIGNGMSALFAHPDQLARLQSRPEQIPAAIQELLRYDGPNQFVRRIVTEPTTIGDRSVEPGDVVYIGIGAANHDPARWGGDADVLRVERPDAAQHLQFGGGVHHCLGAHLARLQAEIALTSLLTRLADLRPNGDVEWSPNMTLRSVSSVPIAYRAGRP